jgi:hypothetical protein
MSWSLAFVAYIALVAVVTVLAARVLMRAAEYELDVDELRPRFVRPGGAFLHQVALSYQATDRMCTTSSRAMPTAPSQSPDLSVNDRTRAAELHQIGRRLSAPALYLRHRSDDRRRQELGLSTRTGRSATRRSGCVGRASTRQPTHHRFAAATSCTDAVGPHELVVALAAPSPARCDLAELDRLLRTHQSGRKRMLKLTEPGALLAAVDD